MWSTRWAPRACSLMACALALIACGGGQPRPERSVDKAALDKEVQTILATAPPAALTESLPDAPPVLITGATLLTAEGPPLLNGWVHLSKGRIQGLGEGDPPQVGKEVKVIDARGQYVTPGLIDTHSHLGVYPSPGVWAHSDGNEMTDPITAGVQAVHAVWPQDPGFERAVAGGVTTLMVLPGSGNLMGGRGVVLKLHPRREVAAMRFPGAKDSLKMACGENPKRIYGKSKGRMPMSRMGNLYLMRQTWQKAVEYRRARALWAEDPYRKEKGRIVGLKPAPKRDLKLETLVGVMAGEILVQIHCYRADEMLQQLAIAEEFGFQVRSFHHAVEAYKIRDVLAEKGVSVSTWADWWGFKIEAHDAIEQNLALLAEAGARGVLHTDSPVGIQRMNQEAAKALYAGRHAGVEVSEEEALRWLTAHPAWTLGIEDQTGTLKAGKMADVVIWDAHPFSVYARARMVFIDGHLRFELNDKPGQQAPTPPWSDFEAGHGAQAEEGAR